MSAPARKPATYDDLIALPEHLVGEIVDGELFASPRPASRHARAASVLGAVVGGPFDLDPHGPGGWWIVDEPELHLGTAVLVPDLAGWRRERMPAFPDVAFFELAPDWVCEVVSPGTARLDRVRKLPIYARQGVAHVWLVDPRAHTVEVFRLQEAQWLLVATFGEGDKMRAEPFAAVEIPLASLWIADAPAAGP
ncbi:MAG: Uma2 family endonuclease [Deltaproteobacteria bacterium]|nr:Uma2 family endonuclease [Deltaproteobacteria bacterium]